MSKQALVSVPACTFLFEILAKLIFLPQTDRAGIYLGRCLYGWFSFFARIWTLGEGVLSNWCGYWLWEFFWLRSLLVLGQIRILNETGYKWGLGVELIWHWRLISWRSTCSDLPWSLHLLSSKEVVPHLIIPLFVLLISPLATERFPISESILSTLEELAYALSWLRVYLVRAISRDEVRKVLKTIPRERVLGM